MGLKTERVILAQEELVNNEFVTYAICPFDQKRVEEAKPYEHFKSIEHGCGGTVFIFVNSGKL